MTENKFLGSDFDKVELRKCDKSCINDFLKVINSETIGKKVLTAFSLKEQGHFNRAMLDIAEVNRDQVIAIREVQDILDKLENREKTEIVFKNFRQTLPLQIGLSNGKDVLELLDGIRNHFEGVLSNHTNELNRVEEELDIKREEFNFFQERMEGKISTEELNDLKEKIAKLTRKAYLAKKHIADTLIEFVTEKYKALVSEDRVSLISNLYLIITSSIETKDSKFVNV